MNIIENFLGKTSRATFGLLDSVLTNLSAWHWLWYFVVGLLATVFLVVGKRLKRFNHPDRPLLSPFIRGGAGGGLKWLGGITLLGLSSLAGSVLILVVVGAAALAGSEKQELWPVAKYYLSVVWPWVKQPVWAVIAGCTSGLITSLYLTFRTVPLWERGEGLRDVRHMQKLFRRMRQFSPLDFIDIKKGIFIGLEEGRRAVYVLLKQIHETHIQILGASGGGKGISLGVLGYQFILARECVIFFDPKGDRRLPIVLAWAAKLAGVIFHIVDLNPTAPPQFNLLAGAKAHEVEEMLVGGLGLEPSSGDGNYYRGLDQDAAQRAASLVGGENSLSLPGLLNLVQSDEAFEKADNFVRRLRQVCDLSAVQTSHDIDLPGIVERGEVLYIRGSTDNHRVKTLQTMLLIRLLQVVKSRGETSRKVTLILDEFKHLLCQVSADSLGTVRELGCHAVLAHQSMGDLGSVPGMRREDVEPRVVDNTTIKLVFRIGDEKASANFAAKSGKQRTHSEGVRGIDEEGHDQRTWAETQQFRMSEDLFTHLHRPSDGTEVVAAGVLFGIKSARLLAVSPIVVDGNMPNVTAAPSESVMPVNKPEALI